MGLSATAHLAARRARTLVLDRFHLNHRHGSSHGRSRILRTVYAEGPWYVPLVQQALREWQALGRAQQTELFTRTGCLMFGSRRSAELGSALRSARVYRLPHELLGAEEVGRRFPAFAPTPSEVALFDPSGGILYPERCLEAFARQATDAGAALHWGERALRWSADDGGVSVQTRRAEYRARDLVIAAGAWCGTLVPSLGFTPVVERQAVFWFRPRTDARKFAAGRMPVFTWRLGPKEFYYGVPDLGDGIKVAGYGGRITRSADRVPRRITPAERRRVGGFVDRYLPGARGPLRSTTTCLFTYTPDRHFVLDRHPRHSNVLLVSPCSGHGFKFASVIGTIVANLVLDGAAGFDLTPFRLDRFRRRRRPKAR